MFKYDNMIKYMFKKKKKKGKNQEDRRTQMYNMWTLPWCPQRL